MYYLFLTTLILLFLFIIFIKYSIEINKEFIDKMILKFKSLSKIFLLPYWMLLLCFTLVIYCSNKIFFDNGFSKSYLKDSLINLNGEWTFHNDAQKDNLTLNLCMKSATKGHYILSQYYDTWDKATSVSKHKISEGFFTISKGYDIYGDKAYIGKDDVDGQQIFVVTELNNLNYCDWMLKIAIIEDEMYGKSMIKISNNCN